MITGVAGLIQFACINEDLLDCDDPFIPCLESLAVQGGSTSDFPGMPYPSIPAPLHIFGISFASVLHPTDCLENFSVSAVSLGNGENRSCHPYSV